MKDCEYFFLDFSAMHGIYLYVLTRLKNGMVGLQRSFRPLRHNHLHLLFLCIH